eukprot:symbB.v1.2.017718.t2/scaffold1384.1/size122353/8
MRNVPWTCAQNGLELQARAGNFERAHGLLERIEKDGVQPNTVTYSSLVNGALQLFEAMVAKGVKVDPGNDQIWHRGLTLHPFDHCEDVGQAEVA